MKNILLPFIVICFTHIGFAQNNANRVNLSGHLKHFNNAVQIEDFSEYQYLLPLTNERMILPDSTGNFKITFSLDSPNYFRIGRNVLYLSPGDNMEVLIDYYDPSLATFKGRGSSANLYLRGTPFPKRGSFLKSGDSIQATPQHNIDVILTAAARRNRELTQIENVSEEFKRLEFARTKADIINSLQMAELYFPFSLKLKGDTAQEFVGKYKNLSTPIIEKYSQNFAESSFLKLVVYRDIASQLIKYAGNTPDAQKIKDWIAASALVDDMQKVEDKRKLAGFSKKIDSIKTAVYTNAAQKSLQNLLAFGKGDQAVDFAAIDLAGNQVKLSDLKGKIIYVDLWATWCGPCIEEMPHFEKLKEKFQDSSDIAFIALSIDDDTDAWEKSVRSGHAKGYQWKINRSKLIEYNIVAIPRSIIIDRDFKMDSMTAPIPSSEESEKMIETLLK